jgi:hypothetical protein
LSECVSRRDLPNSGEAKHALAQAVKVLEQLGVTLNREKTRIVHIATLRTAWSF